MTKKDYELIARALNIHAWNSQGNEKEIEMLQAITRTLCDMLASKNPRFDPFKFTEAVFRK